MWEQGCIQKSPIESLIGTLNISASVVSSVVLGIALVISLGVNLYQWRARGISKPDKKYSTEELQVEAHQNEGAI